VGEERWRRGFSEHVVRKRGEEKVFGYRVVREGGSLLV
jgi:hypothetical protein